MGRAERPPFPRLRQPFWLAAFQGGGRPPHGKSKPSMLACAYGAVKLSGLSATALPKPAWACVGVRVHVCVCTRVCVPRLLIYGEYCSHMEHAQNTLNQLLASREDFRLKVEVTGTFWAVPRPVPRLSPGPLL